MFCHKRAFKIENEQNRFQTSDTIDLWFQAKLKHKVESNKINQLIDKQCNIWISVISKDLSNPSI